MNTFKKFGEKIEKLEYENQCLKAAIKVLENYNTIHKGSRNYVTQVDYSGYYVGDPSGEYEYMPSVYGKLKVLKIACELNNLSGYGNDPHLFNRYTVELLVEPLIEAHKNRIEVNNKRLQELGKGKLPSDLSLWQKIKWALSDK